MTGTGTLLLDSGALLLLVAFAVAAVLDVREREVPDGIWIVLGVVGAVLGAVEVAPGGAVPILLWILAAGFVLEHLVPWDNEFSSSARADLAEMGVYAVVLATVGIAVVRLGLGPDAVPVGVVGVVLVVLFARGLFEAGVLFGGADAKAVMVAGLLVPFFPTPVVPLPASVLPVTAVLPFAVTLLLDAALLSVVAPLAIAVLNLRRGEFRLRDGFTTYTIPVAELPRRWVWVRDPEFPVDRSEEDQIETSEEDRKWRVHLTEELQKRGVARVRVGPQLPFVVFLFAGGVAAVLVGNLVLDALLLL